MSKDARYSNWMSEESLLNQSLDSIGHISICSYLLCVYTYHSNIIRVYVYYYYYKCYCVLYLLYAFYR